MGAPGGPPNRMFALSLGRGFAILNVEPGLETLTEITVLKCPACKEPLIVLEVEGIEIDHCLACGGVWLDGGELELLLSNAGNRDALMGSLQGDVGSTEESIRCPICSKKMEKVRCGTETKIHLDKCPRGDGLWFDRGELLGVLRMGDFPAEDRIYELLHEIFGDKAEA
jgi:Zn-finger nucleic acid-binding protein